MSDKKTVEEPRKFLIFKKNGKLNEKDKDNLAARLFNVFENLFEEAGKLNKKAKEKEKDKEKAKEKAKEKKKEKEKLATQLFNIFENLFEEAGKLNKKDKAKLAVNLFDEFKKAAKLNKTDKDNLAAQLLSVETKKELRIFPHSLEIRGKLGLIVPISTYVQDPLVLERVPILGLQDIDIDWEPCLAAGPTNSRVAVVDYNGDTNKLEDPACWDEDQLAFTGLDKKPVQDSPEEFQFHQVNVWAVVMDTLRFFENSTALGRRISWGFEGNRLIVVPHAGYGKNAYYDRASKSLQFYYCGSKDNPVYTCLSHDIIAHETGHAILDGIRPNYNQLSSKQTDAFHEFIADLTAILVSFRNNDVRHVVVELTKGDLTTENIITKLAEEFGTYVTGATQDCLRSARNSHKMRELKLDQSPHKWSQVLTGAMFEILTELARDYHEKLIEEKPKDEEDPLKYWKTALWRAVEKLIRVSLQPLDYLPPVDIQFEDYVNAVLCRDKLTDPQDRHNHREIMRKVFKNRQIPCWEDEKEFINRDLSCPDIENISSTNAALYHFLNDRREKLFIPEIEDFIIAGVHVSKKVRKAHGLLPREYVIQYLWNEEILLEDEKYASLVGKRIPFYCGGTLVYDEMGNLLYWIRKPGTQFHTGIHSKKADQRQKDEEEEGKKRKERLLEYICTCVKKGTRIALDENGFEGPHLPGRLTAQRHGGVLTLTTNHHFRHDLDE